MTQTQHSRPCSACARRGTRGSRKRPLTCQGSCLPLVTGHGTTMNLGVNIMKGATRCTATMKTLARAFGEKLSGPPHDKRIDRLTDATGAAAVCSSADTAALAGRYHDGRTSCLQVSLIV